MQKEASEWLGREVQGAAGKVMGGMGDLVEGWLGGDDGWVCGIVAWGAVIRGVREVART
jgi:hypothetical protein